MSESTVAPNVPSLALHETSSSNVEPSLPITTIEVSKKPKRFQCIIL